MNIFSYVCAHYVKISKMVASPITNIAWTKQSKQTSK